MPGEPSVRIRDLKRDRVNFVLENVDLALVDFTSRNGMENV